MYGAEIGTIGIGNETNMSQNCGIGIETSGIGIDLAEFAPCLVIIHNCLEK